MAKITLAKHLWKLSTFLPCLLLLVALTVTPLYAFAASNGDKIDMTINMIRIHVEKVKQGNPAISGIDEKVRQTEEKLREGTISPRQACSNCHTKGQGSGPSGP